MVVRLMLAALAAVVAGCVTPVELHPGAAAYLGRICTLESDCAPGYRCVRVENIGSQDDGFCTITCAYGDTEACTDGYTGQGSPACVLSVPPDATACAILCVTPGGAGECPDGLTCTSSLSGNVCVRPA